MAAARGLMVCSPVLRPEWAEDCRVTAIDSRRRRHDV